ncbi:hypothetical protein BACI349Y_580119 [Bacillus sp. 349Y]|nr:hypothetical protein BACI349Y_580119 [Bacillus sp. 349Y]
MVGFFFLHVRLNMQTPTFLCANSHGEVVKKHYHYSLYISENVNN